MPTLTQSFWEAAGQSRPQTLQHRASSTPTQDGKSSLHEFGALMDLGARAFMAHARARAVKVVP